MMSLALVLGLSIASSPTIPDSSRPDASKTPAAPAAGDVTPPLALAQTPEARPKTLAILVLSGEETGVPISEIYSAARRALESNTTFTILPLDVIGISDRENAIRECAGRASCFARKVRSNTSGIDLLLTTSVDSGEGGLLLGLRLVGVEGGEELGATGDEIPAGMSLLGAMEKELSAIVSPDVWGRIAAASIETSPSNAEVQVGSRACASPCELTRMLPGTYPVTLRKTGYEPWRGQIELLPRETTRLSQSLTEVEPSLAESPYLWAGAGVVVVGAAVLTFFLVRPTSQTVDVCVARDPGLCGR